MILRPEGTSGPGARVETAPTAVNPHSTLPPIIGIQADAFKSSEGGSIATSTDIGLIQSGNAVSPSSDASACCFTPGTLVLMADGASLPIERIAIGDSVVGFDGQINEVIGIDTPVLGVRRLFSINGGVPFITPEHPILTTEGWKSFNPTQSAKEDEDLPVTLLELGDLLVTADGTRVLDRAEAESGFHGDIVYTLNVSGNRTFIANGLVVYAVGSFQA